MKYYRLLIISTLALTVFSCNRPIRYDLIVENAAIFDTKTGEVTTGKTILINGDSIVGIINSDEPVRTKKVVDADGRLVTPGNIDTHINFEKAIYSTHKNADNHPKILTNFYRSKCSKNYLPYGITTIVDMTKDFNWASQMVKWQANPKFSDLIVAYTFSDIEQSSKSIDVLLSDLSSIGVNHIYINNDKNNGLTKNIIEMASQKGIDVFIKPINSFSDNNYVNIEYIYSSIINSFEKNFDKKLLLNQVENVYGNVDVPEEIYALEAFKYIVENNPALLDTLANKLSKSPISISTKLNSMAQYTDMSHMESNNQNQFKLSKELKHRITYSFNHLLSFVKRIHNSGTSLRIGTNTENGGMAFISEQLLLAEAGISASDIIKISTLNAAKVLKIDNRFGSIEIGKKADLIIYDQNPIDDYKNFASTRRVIKSGKLFKRNPAKIDMEE
ncbi:MAG TPA: amidohydrolase family protein [Tenuifilaceae bacterium]|nr:amidohydrolase family protein [Tenuifilaceae bacterium]HPI44910.1 amidohydrolase family protein [Tenuifilaceae bacterium]HPN22209.1 amidohydrolase family protein [Tenuifilaceae bacterium]